MICFHLSFEKERIPANDPKMNFKKTFTGGIKAAPTIGIIVGTQMIAQSHTEKCLMKITGKNDKPNFPSMLASTIAVGIVSAPPLAVFNGQTMGCKAMESLKSLSVKQASAIVARETSFLFSLRISDPLGKKMKTIIGDNKVVEYSSAFFSGAIGSFIGHPADTALTLLQKGIQLKSFGQSMRGSPMKALATGGFSVFYKLAKEILNFT